MRDPPALESIGSAVRRYFEAVGREWDDEWLHLDSVEDPTSTTVTEKIQAMTDERPRAAAQVAGG